MILLWNQKYTTSQTHLSSMQTEKWNKMDAHWPAHGDQPHRYTQRHRVSVLSPSILQENRRVLIIYFQVSCSNKEFNVHIICMNVDLSVQDFDDTAQNSE
jgi:hypothetical protein